MDLAALSNGELWLRLRQIDHRLGELRSRADPGRPRLWRTVKLACGALVTFGSIAAGPPTGGASVVLTGIGLILWAEGIRDDAQLYNRSLDAAAEAKALAVQNAEIEAELDRRGIRT